jgi:hypothetical protein
MEDQVEPTQITKSYLDFFKRNKQTFFFVGGAVILLLIIFSLVVISGKNKVNTIPVPRVTPAATNASVQKSITPTTSTTISPQERAIIVTQTKPQLDKLITIDYTIPTVKAYGESWAIMVVNNPNTDPAHIVVKKINGSWKVMMGPGTHFDAQALQAIGAPQGLIDEANSLE